MAPVADPEGRGLQPSTAQNSIEYKERKGKKQKRRGKRRKRDERKKNGKEEERKKRGGRSRKREDLEKKTSPRTPQSWNRYWIAPGPSLEPCDGI